MFKRASAAFSLAAGLTLMASMAPMAEKAFCDDPHFQGAPDARHILYYGYYRDAGLYEEIRDHTNLTIIGPGQDESGRETLEYLRGLPSRGRMRVMLDVQSIFGVSPERGFRPEAEWQAKWDTYSRNLAPYVESGLVAAFYTYDEPADRAPIEFHRDLERVADIIRDRFPGIPVAIGLGWWSVHPDFIGQTVPLNYDWYGFNCYGPFNDCAPGRRGSGIGIPEMAERLKQMVGKDKKILLYPEASTYRYDEEKETSFSEDEIIRRAQQYYDFAKREKSVVGVIPFLWKFPVREDGGTIYGLRDMNKARPVFHAMGRELTRGIPQKFIGTAYCPTYK